MRIRDTTAPLRAWAVKGRRARTSFTTLVALAVTLVAPQGSAQTPLQAAAEDVQRAMTICLQNYRTPDAIGPAFLSVGFAYDPEDFAGEIVDWYRSGRSDVYLFVVGDPGQVTCGITTLSFGVGQAVPFVGQVLEIIAPGLFSPGDFEGGNILPGSPQAFGFECSGFSGLLPQRAVRVSLGAAGNDTTCVEPGNTLITLNM